MAIVRIQTERFDVNEVIEALHGANAKVGAIAVFIGLVRDINADSSVSHMTLEHYPGMTEKALTEIVGEAERRWRLIDVAVVHRVGRLEPTDPIVLVAVASGHRGDAFAACEYIMDFLKTRAPLWKKEQTRDGARWVEGRTSDETAAKRWE